MAMPELTWSAKGYRIKGKPAFAVSGEFHYFRVPHADWRRRLELFKKAGGNAIATYIPWLLHEPTEGDIRFGDKPERDLEAFLRLCLELKLFVIARPGPYQYSELKYDGLPGWLCDGYPEILARDVHGKSFRPSSVSFHHPL
ncbi:MAG: beta-galactosidase, partial [Victivallales bacterium]